MKVAAALCAVLVACVAAQAAEVKVLTHADDGYPALITIKGEIVDGDDKIFQKKAAHLYTAIVYLEGPGGTQRPSLDIGLAIRKNGFRTAVADNAICYSGCALAWLGGVERYVAKHAHIGFHQASTPDTRAPSGYGNAMTGVYLSQLGFPSTTISYVLKALPKTVTVLTPSDARQYGIESLLLPEPEADRYRNASSARHRGTP